MAKDIDDTTHIDDIFEALADPKRRGVIELLRDGPKRASDLASSFKVTPPTMSRHLKILRTSGLVAADGEDHDARVRMYRLCDQPLDQLKSWVEDAIGELKSDLDRLPGQVARKRRKR